MFGRRKEKTRGIIEIDLRGCWADWDKRKRQFALQMAMYNTVGNCDWDITIKETGTTGYVFDPYFIEVVATRCHSIKYEEGKLDTKDLTKYAFKFTIPSYTLINIYYGAVKALKNCREIIYVKEKTK